MTRFLVSAIILLTLATTIWVSWFADNSFQSKFSQTVEILSAFSSFLTLIIALLLFNRFGIDQTLLDKQTTAVLTLLDTIRKFKLSMSGSDKLFLFFAVERTRLAHFRRDQYSKHVLLFSSVYMEAIEEINSAVDNVFMPPSILQEFSFVRITVFAPTSEKSLSKGYFKVDPVGSFRKNEEKTMYGFLDEEKLTLAQYIDRWTEAIKSIEDWLRDNSSLRVSLNI